MKRISIILLAGILCTLVSTLEAAAEGTAAEPGFPAKASSYETYCYKQVTVVDVNGARSKGNGKLMYITFFDDYRKCYESDREGNDLAYNRTYQFSFGLMIFRQTNSKGIHIYDSVVKSWPRQPDYFSGNMAHAAMSGHVQGEVILGGFVTYYFNGDFTRLNSRRELDGSHTATTVWQRIDESRQSDDMEFY